MLLEHWCVTRYSILLFLYFTLFWVCLQFFSSIVPLPLKMLTLIHNFKIRKSFNFTWNFSEFLHCRVWRGKLRPQGIDVSLSALEENQFTKWKFADPGLLTFPLVRRQKQRERKSSFGEKSKCWKNRKLCSDFFASESSRFGRRAYHSSRSVSNGNLPIQITLSSYCKKILVSIL